MYNYLLQTLMSVTLEMEAVLMSVKIILVISTVRVARGMCLNLEMTVTPEM